VRAAENGFVSQNGAFRRDEYLECPRNQKFIKFF
jgi:hypothetical protein